jgi:uracil phosphoribosyltransferase
MLLKTVLYLHQDTHPITMITLKSVLNTKLLILITKYLLLVDPMLATGQSIIAVFNRLMERGVAKEIHIAVVIAPEGIAHLENTA